MKPNNRLYWILLILSALCCVWIGFNFFTADGQHSPVTVCLFKNITGLPCPSCGTTRSLLLVIAGDLRGAWLTNPLGLFAAITLAVVPVWIFADLLARKNTLALLLLWTERKVKSNKSLYIPLVALALLNWGWNVLKEL